MAVDYHYYNSAGKRIKRDIAIGALTTGSSVTVESLMSKIKITKSGEKMLAGCKEHNAAIECVTPGRALQWAEEHLRQHHD